MTATKKVVSPRGGKVFSRPRWVFGFFLVGAIVCGVVGGYYCLRVEIPEPPTVELTKLEPPAVAAIQQARAAVLQSPRSAAAWGRLGVVLGAFKFNSDARACFACAERLDSRDTRWPYLQAHTLEPNDPETIPKLQRAVDVDANPPDSVRLDLAEALLAHGRLDEAEQHCRAVLRHDSANSRTHLGLARLAFARGRLSESLASLQRAADNPFTQKAACRLLAQVHQATGDAAAASQDTQRLNQLPEDRFFPLTCFAQEIEQLVQDRTALSRAEQMANHGRLAEALTILQRLVDQYPDWGMAWLDIGQLFERGQNHAAAETALRKATRLLPGLAKPHYCLGLVLTEQGKHREAVAAFRQATELQSDFAEAHFGLSRCLQAEGDRKGAEQALRAAIRYLPTSAKARVTLGELLAQSGRPVKGLEQLRSAARLRPDDPNIRELIQQWEAKCPAAPPMP
jgi:tetratricopeptide (TPR) repeat protein